MYNYKSTPDFVNESPNKWYTLRNSNLIPIVSVEQKLFWVKNYPITHLTYWQHSAYAIADEYWQGFFASLEVGKKIMMQLEVFVSPPAFLWDPYLTLTNVIFDLDINFYLVIFGPMNYFLVTDRQTDRWTDRRKVMHKSPPCMSTGGLKN